MDEENRWISVDKRSNKLSIRFWVKGYPKQFQIASRLKNTKKNREIVKIKRDAIMNDIALGQFDPSLERYQFRASAIAPVQPVVSLKNEYDLRELWSMFTEFQSTQLEPTTIYINYRTIGKLIDKLPFQSIKEAPKIRSWLLNNNPSPVTWRYLLRFDQCCRWAVDEGLIESNPFEKLKIKKPKTSSNPQQAFTLEQRDLIIRAFEEDERYSHYANLIKFLFWTGCRHGECFALTWGDISNCCQFITFSKSRNLLGLEKSTKNNKTRIFQCGENSRLLFLVRSLRTEEVGKDTPLFLTKKVKRRICSSQLSYAWNRNEGGQPGVVRKLADNGLVPYLKPYSTRHTFATWAIASGSTPDKVAYWIGDEVATVLKYYVHPEVSRLACPDF